MSTVHAGGLAWRGLARVVLGMTLCASVCFALLAQGGCQRGLRTGAAGPDRAEAVRESSALFAQGRRAEQAEQWDRAIELYQRAVVLNPDFGAAWNNLGSALARRAGEMDRLGAQQAYQRAASLLPTDPAPNRNLGTLYLNQGWAGEAARYFRDALAIDPNDVQSLRGLASAGKLLRESGQWYLEHLRRAQLVEADPRWREIIVRERLRVESDQEESRR